jgi:hypothetical protein
MPIGRGMQSDSFCRQRVGNNVLDGIESPTVSPESLTVSLYITIRYACYLTSLITWMQTAELGIY